MRAYEINESYNMLNEAFWDKIKQAAGSFATATKALFDDKALSDFIINSNAKKIQTGLSNAIKSDALIGGYEPKANGKWQLEPKSVGKYFSQFSSIEATDIKQMFKDIKNDPVMNDITKNYDTAGYKASVSDQDLLNFSRKLAAYAIRKGWIDLESLVDNLPQNQKQRYMNAISGMDIEKNAPAAKNVILNDFYKFLEEHNVIEDASNPPERLDLTNDHLVSFFSKKYKIFSDNTVKQQFVKFLKKSNWQGPSDIDRLSEIFAAIYKWMKASYLVNNDGEPRDFKNILNHIKSSLDAWGLRIDSNKELTKEFDAQLKAAGFTDGQIIDLETFLLN